MKRPTIIAAAIGALCLTATLAEQQATNDLGFLQTLNDYITAAVNGETDVAAKLGAPHDASSDTRAITELGAVLPKAPLPMSRYLHSEQGKAALVISASFEPRKPLHGRGQAIFVFTLTKSTGKWLVEDIDVETELGVQGEVERFRERYADAVDKMIAGLEADEETAGQPPLEFRILPNLPDEGRQPMLTQTAYDAMKAKLPVTGEVVAELSGNRFQWCEVAASMDELPFIAERDGKKFAVVSADPSRVLQWQPTWQFRDTKSQFDSLGPRVRCLGIELDSAGAACMRELTKTNLHNRLAIIVDGKLVSAPKIMGEIGGRAQITGDFSDEEWKWLKDTLFAAAPARTAGDELDVAAGQSPSSDETMSVYYLKYIKADEANVLLLYLYRNSNVTIAADARLNALIVRGRQDQLKEVEALLTKIDVPANDASAALSQSTGRDLPSAVREVTVGELRQQYSRYEQEAARLASEVQVLKNVSPVDPQLEPGLKQQVERRIGELRQVVQQAFDTRQQLQRAELSQLRQRLVRIERLIAARDHSKQQIIDRRVEELVNAELQWSPAGMPDTSDNGAVAEPLGARLSTNQPALARNDLAKQDAETARTLTLNNLKRLGLAMYKYHDQHRHFPPAVILGKDGKGTVPHSWRVEMLPHLDAQKLYDEYRFDEAWDGDHNRQLLEKIPAVFRCPLDDIDSVNTSYFGVVATVRPTGQGDADDGTPNDSSIGGQVPDGLRVPEHSTVFSRPDGAKLVEITDGTSPTIAIVEAKRKVPWTKPEDIPFDPSQPSPKFDRWYDGGFFAGMADGAALFISDANDEQTVRNLITINDGQPIELVK